MVVSYPRSYESKMAFRKPSLRPMNGQVYDGRFFRIHDAILRDFFSESNKTSMIYELPRLKLSFTKLYSILLDVTLDDHPIISRNLLPIFSYVLISKSVGFAKHSDFGYVTTDSLHMGAG